MHKKLVADLTSIAHRILQLKNKEDVIKLKKEAYEVYEKLTILAYVDEYLATTPNATETKEEIVDALLQASTNTKEEVALVVDEDLQEDEITEVELITKKVEKIVGEFIDDSHSEEPLETSKEDVSSENAMEEITEQPFDELEQTLFSSENINIDQQVKDSKSVTLEEELNDTISLEVAADLFEKPEIKKSLNDQLQQNIQIGLNDRIAFVKNLFDGSQEEFNRVVSQLNSFKTEKDAKKFINKMVKPDYDWTSQEEYETRFFEIIERKFA
ncbi:MAG: hypothetical protein P8H13_01625 [Polaribacter sp.]|nr:hypothetical protein [Polaribacter sp.]MDG1810621.1 hypothetical protein [Polaribacter sp.]MDG1992922.1 hypothetical protein [Polaribacter sp.]